MNHDAQAADPLIAVSQEIAKLILCTIDSLPFDNNEKCLCAILAAAFVREINRATIRDEGQAEFDQWQAQAEQFVRNTIAPSVASFRASHEVLKATLAKAQS